MNALRKDAFTEFKLRGFPSKNGTRQGEQRTGQSARSGQIPLDDEHRPFVPGARDCLAGWLSAHEGPSQDRSSGV